MYAIRYIERFDPEKHGARLGYIAHPGRHTPTDGSTGIIATGEPIGPDWVVIAWHDDTLTSTRLRHLSAAPEPTVGPRAALLEHPDVYSFARGLTDAVETALDALDWGGDGRHRGSDHYALTVRRAVIAAAIYDHLSPMLDEVAP